MQHNKLWMAVILIMAGLQLVACTQTPAGTATKIAPAKVEPIEGTNLKRLTLLPEAAKRLDIQTAPVREEPVVRKRKVGAEVVALPATSPSGTTAAPGASPVWVRVRLNESDREKVNRSQPPRILPLTDDDEDDDDEATGLTAELDEAPDDDDSEEATTALYYRVDRADRRLAPGQRVFVELTLVNSAMPRKIIPYTAVLYDSRGDTWVYTNPEPLVFVRDHISISYIEGDLAVLFAGPPAGTAVVTVGAAELYGAEFGVGK